MTDQNTAITEAIDKIQDDVSNFIKQHNDDVKATGDVSKEALAFAKKTDTQIGELADRVLELEQKKGAAFAGTPEESIGVQFVKSAAFSAMHEGNSAKAAMHFEKNTIVGSDAIVSPDRRPGIVSGPQRVLRVVDVMGSGQTSSNAVEYTRETGFTNSAQETAEGAVKAESAVTFSLENMPVATIAHWIKLSKQVMDDAPRIASYIDGRMQYGVLLRLDNQLIVGNGTGANLSGLMNTGNYTVRAAVGADHFETIRKAITQVSLADYQASAVILNPADLEVLDLTRDTTGQFISVDPNKGNRATSWGLDVVVSNAMPSGNFLVGAFDMASEFLERQGVTVDISDSDGDNFTSNLVTLRAEMRGAAIVTRPESLVGGALV